MAAFPSNSDLAKMAALGSIQPLASPSIMGNSILNNSLIGTAPLISTAAYATPSLQLTTPLESERSRINALCFRLRINEGDMIPFDHLHTCFAGEKVFVLVVQHGSAVLLEDPAGLFPSDTLVTQLGLLRK